MKRVTDRIGGNYDETLWYWISDFQYCYCGIYGVAVIYTPVQAGTGRAHYDIWANQDLPAACALRWHFDRKRNNKHGNCK